MSFAYRFLLLLLSTAACLMLALQGYHRWIDSPFFANGGKKVPYNTEDFAYLFVFFVTAPLALALSFIVSRVALKAPFNIGYLVSIGIAAGASALSVKYNVTYQQCGIVNCYNTGSRTIENPPDLNKNFIGFSSSMMSLIFVPVFFFLVTLVILLTQNVFTFVKSRFFSSVVKKNESLNASLLNSTSTDSISSESSANISAHVDKLSYLPQKENLITLGLHFVCYIALTILYWYMSMIATNSYRKFNPWNIADNLEIDVTQDLKQCAKGPGMCPERGGAYFTTFAVKLADKLKLKSFPSLTLMYAFLLSFCLLAVAVTIARKRGSSFFTHPLRISSSWSIFGFFINKNKKTGTYSMYTDAFQLIVFSLFSAFLVSLTIYWQHDHNFKTKWPRFELSTLEVSMRASGCVAAALMALQLFPVAKTSHVLKILNLSYETSLQYHRIVGVVCLVGILIHVITAYVLVLQRNGISTFFYIPFRFKFSLDTISDWTVPIMNYITLFAIVTLTFAAIPYCRRNYYRIFLYSHYITYLVLIPATLFHAAGAIQYFIPALFVYIIDFCFQTYRRAQTASLAVVNKDSNPIYGECASHSKAVSIHDFGAAGQYIVMDIVKPGFTYQAGQYVFVNIAEASLVEWHPYTIASAEKHGDTHQFTLFIKVMENPYSWTQALYTYIKEKSYSPKFNLTVSIDGPYAQPVDYSQYQHVVLLAGGAGITPCISIYETLYNMQIGLHTESANEKYRTMRANLLFIARDPSLFSVVRNRLVTNENFAADLYCTNQDLNENSPWKQRVQSSRPDIVAYLEAIHIQTSPQDKVLVFVCGPTDIQTEARDFCYNHSNYTFHTETFDF